MCVSIVTVNPIKFKIYIKYLKYILILYIIKVKYHIYLFSNIYHIVPIVKILKSKIKKKLYLESTFVNNFINVNIVQY